MLTRRGTDVLKALAAKGGVIGFQIGNEFHNVKVFNWRTEHAGKPFWDTPWFSATPAVRDAVASLT